MSRISRVAASARPQIMRKRVAAYARVSMETEKLLHSLSAQVSHYSMMIQANPQWEYAGVYADEGISGRSTAPREEFNRMMGDCDAGKIDLILTKSISRFARDTVDCLKAVRHLKTIGVEVRFERESISTFSTGGELLLTLLASMAQEESISLSQNIKWAIRKRFAAGIPNGHKAPYGYKWDGEMFRIVPHQGEVVKYIYACYLGGDSAHKIAKMLKEQGVIGNKGIPLDESTIKDIVSSSSYTGTMLLQKNYMDENHKRKRNKGELPRYAVDGMFEPLVSKEDYERALAIRKIRAEASANRNLKLTRFSGLVKCGDCGRGVSRRTAGLSKRWVCNTRERKGRDVCNLPPIKEEELIAAAESVIGSVSDEEFRRMVDLITIYGDRIEFRFKNGKVKNVVRT